MKLTTHHSSSRGNLYMVTSQDGHRLMIECGVSWKAIMKALDYDLDGVEACLVTHLHKDHSKALKDVNKAGIDLYASAETLQDQGLLHRRRAYAVSDKTLITNITGFQVYCFTVEHDCQGCLGYIVREEATDEYLLFATDTSHLRQEFRYLFNIVAIECSYDPEILHAQVEEGEIHEAVAKRLLTSHMSKDTTLAYLRENCDLSRCREIHLLHMSGDRIDKEAARIEIENKLFIETHYHKEKK